MQKAAFLDRDGVINVDKGYVYKIKDFEFIPGVFTAAQRLVQLGYRLIIVSNQSGIGKGYFKQADFDALMAWVTRQFAEHDVPLTAVYHCPYHPTEGLGEYRRQSVYRKPNPQMLLDAASEHQLDLQQSFIVGDKLSDLQAGRNAGLANGYLVKSPHNPTDAEREQFTAGLPVYTSLAEVVQKHYL